jgi:hypothetical protein
MLIAFFKEFLIDGDGFVVLARAYGFAALLERVVDLFCGQALRRYFCPDDGERRSEQQ